MENEYIILDGAARRRARKITCEGCGTEWLVRKDRKHSGYCRSCKFSGEKNPSYGKQPHNYINGKRDKECTTEYSKKVRRERKKKIILMMGNMCHHCGAKNLPICCYHTHHVDPETKVFSIMSKLNENRLFKNNWEIILQEIKKCELLCIHCHKIHHFGDERAEDS